MHNHSSNRLRPLVVAALFVVSAPAFATTQRTFVSSNGKDTDPCSITAPCRSFLAAIAQTSANGEVIVQDSAGYGPVTITKSVSVIAPAGVYGGISVFPGTGAGITIDGGNIKVVLRGLTINGQGGTNDGIAFAQGAKLTVEDCEIANMGNFGISAYADNSTVTVKNTVMRDNLSHGFFATVTVVATLDGVHAETNGGFGVYANAGAQVTIANSVLASNAMGGVYARALFGTATDVMVTRSIIRGRLYGLFVMADAGGVTRLVSDGNVITDVAVAAFYFGGGGGSETMYTLGNNTVVFQIAIVVGGSLTPLGTL